MKAIVTRKYGGPEVLELAEVPDPAPGESDVLIRVRASTVATSGSFMRRGTPFLARMVTGIFSPKHPIPGTDLAGEVEAVGSAVTTFSVGDRVFAASDTTFSAHAERIALPESGAIAKMPSNMGFDEAAALCEGAVTALAFLRDHARLQPGARLLVNGASGAIGTAAVQLGKAFQATVVGVCSGRNTELVRSLGADEVLDYTTTDFSRFEGAYDVIFDTVGKSSFQKSKRALAAGGSYLSPVMSMALMMQMLWTSKVGDRKAKFAATGLRSPEEKRKDMEYLAELVEQGELRSIIDRRYPLAKAAEAASYVDEGHKRGNVVLIMDAAQDSI